MNQIIRKEQIGRPAMLCYSSRMHEHQQQQQSNNNLSAFVYKNHTTNQSHDGHRHYLLRVFASRSFFTRGAFSYTQVERQIVEIQIQNKRNRST